MILYKRIISDKSGKLEKVKKIDFPTENFLSMLEKIIYEILESRKKDEIFFIIFSCEEEQMLINSLSFFSKNQADLLLRTIINKFFENKFGECSSFASYFCIKDNMMNILNDNDVMPNLGIQIPPLL